MLLEPIEDQSVALAPMARQAVVVAGKGHEGVGHVQGGEAAYELAGVLERHPPVLVAMQDQEGDAQALRPVEGRPLPVGARNLTWRTAEQLLQNLAELRPLPVGVDGASSVRTMPSGVSRNTALSVT